MESSSSSSKYDFDAMELEDEEKLQVCLLHIPHNHMAYIGHIIIHIFSFALFALHANTHTHDTHSYTSHVNTGSTQTCRHSLTCRRTIDTSLLFKQLPLATPTYREFLLRALSIPPSLSLSLSLSLFSSFPSFPEQHYTGLTCIGSGKFATVHISHSPFH